MASLDPDGPAFIHLHGTHERKGLRNIVCRHSLPREILTDRLGDVRVNNVRSHLLLFVSGAVLCSPLESTRPYRELISGQECDGEGPVCALSSPDGAVDWRRVCGACQPASQRGGREVCERWVNHVVE